MACAFFRNQGYVEAATVGQWKPITRMVGRAEENQVVFGSYCARVIFMLERLGVWVYSIHYK